MAFTSAAFVGLTALAVVLYYALPKRAQWCVLLLASLAFYLAGGVKSVVWLVLIILITWTAGLLLGRQNAKTPADKAEKAAIQRRKKIISTFCAISCFGLLFAMKYWNFTLELLPSALGQHIPRWDFLVPLGLSFFIFQSMSYVIDVYRNKQKCEKNVLKYALFVSFFPQMVRGPISRYGQLAPQLTAERSPCWADLQAGVQLALWGYFKKLVIADRAAILVNNVISETCPYGGAVIATGIFFYCIQLYCDFSGGIDITRGVARLFGIDMVQNFRRPLFATSLTDYWRRWHITLGSWMRDYVFYPLSLSKPFGKLGKWARKHLKGTPGKIFATSAATFIVYLIIGIWHGANFRYIGLRPLERYAHHGLAADGAPLPRVEIRAAHQRQVHGLAHLYDRAHGAARLHRPLLYARAAPDSCIFSAENHGIAPEFRGIAAQNSDARPDGGRSVDRRGGHSDRSHRGVL